MLPPPLLPPRLSDQQPPALTPSSTPSNLTLDTLLPTESTKFILLQFTKIFPKNLDPKPKHAINPKAPPSPLSTHLLCETKLVLPTQIFCWEITVFTSKKKNCILCEELSRYR